MPYRLALALLALAPFVACADDDSNASRADSSSGSDSGPATTANDTTAADSSTGQPSDTTGSSGSTGGTESTGADTTEGSDTTSGGASGELELDEIIDTNAVVATKGMDVADDGTLWIWNYNQDNLERFDGRMLETVVVADYATSFGTDLSLDADGSPVVSRGGSTTGETLIKWDSTGTPQWGPMGITYPGALMLGLTHATVEGSAWLYACDGAAAGGQVHRIDPSDGTIMESIAVDGVPLDVAVDGSGQLYVLTSADSNPAASGEPVYLRKYDATGTELASTRMLTAAVYLALGDNDIVYVSITDFDAPTRSIASFDTDLAPLAQTELPKSYEGFAGGIAVHGEGDDLRVFITGQEGIGSGPICDVLVYRPV